MTGYYDQGPLVDLPRALVLTSPLGELARAVAYRTSALSGLPYHDIDRLVEHESGQDRYRLVHFEGQAAYCELESRCLERVMRERPFGVVALGDGGLSAESLVRVSRHADLVALDLDPANLYWRIQGLSRERKQTTWSPLFDGLPQSPEDLRPYVLERRRLHESAALRIDASALRVSEIGERVLRWIEARQDRPAT